MIDLVSCFVTSLVMYVALLPCVSNDAFGADSVFVTSSALYLHGRIATAGTTRDTSFMVYRGRGLKVVGRDTIDRAFICELGNVTGIRLTFYQADSTAPAPRYVLTETTTTKTAESTKSIDNTQTSTDDTSVSQRCSAFTKKGTQCRRTAGPSGRCWQH